MTSRRAKKSEAAAAAAAAGLMIFSQQQEKKRGKPSVRLPTASSVVRSMLCVFLPGGSSPRDTRRRRRCRRLPSLPSGRRCQPDESLSHGFIDGQSRLRRRPKCQVDCQADTRVAAAAAAAATTAAVDLDLRRSWGSFWSCRSRKSCRFRQGLVVAFLHHTAAEVQVTRTPLYHVTTLSAGRPLLIGRT